MAKNQATHRLRRAILTLREQGAIDEATSAKLMKLAGDLGHGLAVRNHKQVEVAVSRICEALIKHAG
jgi:hypothetical protein